MRPKSGLKFPRPLNNYFMDIFVGTLFVLDFGIFLGYVTKKEYIYILGFLQYLTLYESHEAVAQQFYYDYDISLS